MVEDSRYSGKEFHSLEEMHLYWAENLMDELNKHDREKARKALKKKEREDREKKRWRKKMALRGLAGFAAVVAAYFAAPLIAGFLVGSPDVEFSEEELEGQPVIGSSDAEVTVVEFGDYLCSGCRSFNQQIKPDIQDHIESGDARFIFIDFPLSSFRPENVKAAQAAECVYREDPQGYWEFHDALYAAQGTQSYTASGLGELAEQTADVNGLEISSCVESGETLEAVQNDRGLGTRKGVSGTPTVFVNGEGLDDISRLEAAVESELEA